MNINEALEILDGAINGRPTSCMSDHVNGLKAIREFISTAPTPPPSASADATAEAPAPVLKKYTGWVTLVKTYAAEDESSVEDQIMDDIADRDGMDISKITVLENFS